MPHDVAWLDVSMIYWWILFLLHIAECFQNLSCHLIDFVNRQTQVASGVVLQVLAFKKLHQSIEQSLLSAVVKLELYDVRVVERFQCLKLIDGIIYRCITLEDLDGKVLLLHIVPYLEHTSETTSTKYLVKSHRRSNLYTRLHVLQICYLWLSCGSSTCLSMLCLDGLFLFFLH